MLNSVVIARDQWASWQTLSWAAIEILKNIVAVTYTWNWLLLRGRQKIEWNSISHTAIGSIYLGKVLSFRSFQKTLIGLCFCYLVLWPTYFCLSLPSSVLLTSTYLLLSYVQEQHRLKRGIVECIVWNVRHLHYLSITMIFVVVQRCHWERGQSCALYHKNASRLPLDKLWSILYGKRSCKSSWDLQNF